MDINLAVIYGRLATVPEVRTTDAGARTARFLVTVASDHPRRRLDVVPVTFHAADADPDAFDIAAALTEGSRIWVAGAIQRRLFDDQAGGRRTRVEVVAQQVTTATEEAGR